MEVNPQYTTFCVESYKVNMRYLTCRICDSMRYVVVFHRETVLSQVSTKKRDDGGGGVKNNKKLRDVIYGRPLIYLSK